MKYIYDNIESWIKESLVELEKKLEVKLGLENSIELGVPRNPEHGDLATNIAFLTAGKIIDKGVTEKIKPRPPDVAQELAIILKTICKKEIVEKVEDHFPGFINFTYSKNCLIDISDSVIIEKENYGRADFGNKRRVNLEFVSANPTGPLNIVSARAAALGDSLKRILNFCGYEVKSEFYVNDEGLQMLRLGHSVLARKAELLGIDYKFPEDGYKGEYISEIAKKYTIDNNFDFNDMTGYAKYEAGKFAIDIILGIQLKSLEQFKVNFDIWYRESDIRNNNKHIEIKAILEQVYTTYLKDGAVYFKSTAFGDDEDRVIWTSDGRPTYFLPDIAYHQDKYDRSFDWIIDIWGPDHHGYIPRMKAALKALGHEVEKPEVFTVIIAQQVNLMRGGQKVVMSKRAGEFVTMDELIEEVGVDAVRFFFLQRKASAHLDFDLDLAVKETEENPVFYVQYAHARICSIERFAEENGINGDIDWNFIKEPEEFTLIRKIAQFPTIVEECGRSLEPHKITVYLQELAKAFHYFYQKHRVVTTDKALSRARLALCQAVRQTLANGLGLLGVTSPEKM